MSVKLRLGEREYLADGKYHGAVVHRVDGMPEGQKARIESANLQGTRWRVDHYIDGYGWRHMGDYPTTDKALAGLENHLKRPA